MGKSSLAQTTSQTTSVSLLDVANSKVAEWYVCYFERQPPYGTWVQRFLKPGFKHVELARPIYCGPGLRDVVWLLLLPSVEMMEVRLCTDSRAPWERCPGATVQKVTSVRKFWRIRSWFFVGPVSCVEIAKLALGIGAPWIRTPYQLFRYIQKRAGRV